MPSQFIRINCYGVQPSARRKPHETASGIIAEAMRAPGSVPHIFSPQAAIKRHGVSLDVIQARVAAFANIARDRRGARLRRDSTVLYAVVVSYPERRTKIEGADTYRKWLDTVVTWLKAQFGEHLQAIVEHQDESHPHLHAFVIPPLSERNRIDHRLHPGYSAREVARRVGADHRKAEQAYRQGMREWQDAFHEAVSRQFGHERIGPKRKRFRRDAALMRQAGDRFLEAAETVFEQLAHRLEILPGINGSEEHSHLERIATLLKGARRRLLDGHADAIETLQARLAQLTDTDHGSAGECDEYAGDDHDRVFGVTFPSRDEDDDIRPSDGDELDFYDEPDWRSEWLDKAEEDTFHDGYDVQLDDHLDQRDHDG